MWLKKLIFALLFLLLLVACQEKKAKKKHTKNNEVSADCIQMQSADFDEKDMKNYERKFKEGPKPVIEEHIITNEEIRQAKKEALVFGVKTLQNVFTVIPIPLISPTLHYTFGKAVSSVRTLEAMNKEMKRKTGIGVGLDQNKAELEYSHKF